MWSNQPEPRMYILIHLSDKMYKNVENSIERELLCQIIFIIFNLQLHKLLKKSCMFIQLTAVYINGHFLLFILLWVL